VRTSRALPTVVAIAIALAASAAADAQQPTLRVLAAASLTDVVGELAGHFEHAWLDPSFASSSELARQIADGAPADVLLSASPEWIAFLREKNALAHASVVFARNTLVCVAPRGRPLLARNAKDLGSLATALRAGDLVAIADAGVPAGEYARQALAAAGVAERLRPLLVGRKDVRAVLQSVESGEMNAGFVYATDARVGDVAVLFTLDPASHAPILFEAAVPRATKQRPLADRFVEFLRGEAAQRVLREAGFTAPE
jgi:molybdate transport system substrate-binding protein